jgi:hypothetical protein
MATPQKRCSRCQGALAPAVIEQFSGEDSGVRLSVEGLPALACAEGHRRFLAPDFPNRLMDALLAGAPLVPLPGAAQKGLLRKRLHCASCGGPLDAQSPLDVEAARVLEIKGGSSFGVRVTAPKFRCAACGAESSLPERTMLDALLKASVNGFRAARIDPN